MLITGLHHSFYEHVHVCQQLQKRVSLTTALPRPKLSVTTFVKFSYGGVDGVEDPKLFMLITAQIPFKAHVQLFLYIKQHSATFYITYLVIWYIYNPF